MPACLLGAGVALRGVMALKSWFWGVCVGCVVWAKLCALWMLPGSWEMHKTNACASDKHNPNTHITVLLPCDCLSAGGPCPPRGSALMLTGRRSCWSMR